jgi:EAL domain-containing protein (putative c-di-GMP-specific phosphodiesterase class I)/DNA-binding CsgD family transcriptional regulator
MRVLVFDDDAAIGRLAVRIATMSGMEATVVSSAEAFAEHLRNDPPQAVLLDLQLGDTDGVKQMRVLADHQYAGAVVLMSGYDIRVLNTARTVGLSLGLKILDVLEKPLQVAELERAFQRLRPMKDSLSAERLQEAIANDELVLDFQPIVTREPKILKKLEALVRWEHPVAGLIPPDDFLPIAESDAATIDALTNWVVGAAVDAYRVLAELRLSVPLSVNISALNLHDLTLPDRLEERLQAGGMPPHHLCLEVTESAVFKDGSRNMEILSRIRLKGMLLSIDDFGAGYSSLKLLRQMPFSEIKIDQSFISDVTTSRDSRAIVKSIIDLAGNMDMACVAEGVETAEIADLIEQLGICDMQGYLIARPMPIEAVPAWLAIWTQSAAGMRRDQVENSVQEPVAVPDHVEVSVASSAPLPVTTKRNVVNLSPRQLEVMQLLSEGCAIKEVAYRLHLGIGTVKVHLALAYSALGARNRIEAIRNAGPALLSR